MNDLGRALINANKTHSTINSSISNSKSLNNGSQEIKMRNTLLIGTTFLIADLIFNDGKIIRSLITSFKHFQMHSPTLKPQINEKTDPNH